ARLDVERFDPFELIVVTPSSAVGFAGGGALRRYATNRPLLFTSSSLGDELVEPPRRALFESMVTRANNPLEGQLRFQRHQWPLARHISVLMERPGAATVSRTTIDLTARGMRVHYEPLPFADACGPPRAA